MSGKQRNKFSNIKMRSGNVELQLNPIPNPKSMVSSYQECLKNHAATVGGHALDGCGEFMLSLTATPTDPTSLNCAACGCHRNFHRRYHPYRFCRAPNKTESPSSPEPLAISQIPPPLQFSAPQMLLALSSGTLPEEYHGGELRRKDRKRKRTKFSRDQKEKMQLFSEKMGWKIRKSDERLVEEFCNEIGIGKRVLRVWMHNNKYMVGGKTEKNRASQSSENGGNHDS